MSVEAQRHLLEELNVLETSAAQRFRKNPSLRSAAEIQTPDDVLESKPKRPHRETISQSHELKYFKHQYGIDAERCRRAFDGPSIASEISSVVDPKMKFDSFLRRVQDIDKKYYRVIPGNASSLTSMFSMYSSAPQEDGLSRSKTGKIKRKYYLATGTEHIDVKLRHAFNEVEAYGKYVDLSLFYDVFKTLSGSQQGYVDYLSSFTDFEGCSKTPAYTRYLESLLCYLERFCENSFPLHELESIKSSSNSDSSLDQENGKANSQGEFFCKPCDRLFAKESVYTAHLAGKKHKKNDERAREGSQNISNGKAEEAAGYKALEAQIKAFATKLKPVIDNTINDHHRRSRFSDREQELEKLAIEGDLSDYTCIDSDSGADQSEDDDDLEDAFAKDLPLGADGIPIPLWLYKLQGLHRTYSCEVCGNVAYKGRQQFNKHFGMPKHVHGLMCLGVSEHDTGLFANISTIAGVQELWNSVRSSKQSNEEEEDNAVEVEDEDGNVMSRKDYEELKKQGLI